MLPCVHIARPTSHRIELTLSGEIDIASAGELADAADLVLAAAPRDVGLDLRQVTFFSAVGLRFLLNLKENVAHHGGNLTVAPIPRCVALVVQASAAAPVVTRRRVLVRHSGPDPVPAAIRPWY